MKAGSKMIRGWKWITGLLCMMVVLGFFSTESDAKMKPKLMALNRTKPTTIKEDLDGDGIEDKIIFRLKKNGEESYVFTLHINGEKFGQWVGDFEGSPMMLITDMDDRDFYKELWIADDYHGSLRVCIVFRVGESHFSTLYDYFKRESEKDLLIPAMVPEEIVSKGDGYISYEVESFTRGLGCYYYDVKLKLSKDGFKIVGDEKKQRITDFWRSDRPYKLTKALKVYSKWKGKQVKFHLKKGDVFYLYELKFTGRKKDENGYLDFYGAWAFIKTKKGKSGWIKVPEGDFYRAPDGFKYEWG